MKQLARSVYKRFRSARSAATDRRGRAHLAVTRREQQARFPEIAHRAAGIYAELAAYDIDRFMTPGWNAYNERLRALLEPSLDPGFLRHPDILATMFMANDGSFLRDQCRYVFSRLQPVRLHELLEEDWVGDPVIRNRRYMTSHNRIHHLYHLLKFQEATGHDLAGIGSIVEWGGGYGDMARLLKRINPGSTYTIIDGPLFSSVQWAYLSATMGADKVHLIRSNDDAIRPGVVNILSLPFVEAHALSCELFLATWSLSESSDHAINLVTGREFFGAERLLIAYQEQSPTIPFADLVADAAKSRGAIVQPFEPADGNFYAFK